MPTSIIVILIILAFFAATIFFLYRQLISLNEEVNGNWLKVTSELNRRANLIPQLTEKLKKYLKDDKELLDALSESEQKTFGARSVSETVFADKFFSEIFSVIIVEAESYPKLTADRNYNQLIFEFLDVEEKLHSARRDYNISAKALNKKLKSFPLCQVNNLFGHFPERSLFLSGDSKKTKKPKRRA